MASASASETGLTPSFTPALSNTVTNIKTTGGRLYGYHIENPNIQKAYVQFFNALAVNVILGTTTPYFPLNVPAGGVLDTFLPNPVSFGVAHSIAATTTATGNTAPSSGLIVTIFYL